MDEKLIWFLAGIAIGMALAFVMGFLLSWAQGDIDADEAKETAAELERTRREEMARRGEYKLEPLPRTLSPDVRRDGGDVRSPKMPPPWTRKEKERDNR